MRFRTCPSNILIRMLSIPIVLHVARYPSGQSLYRKACMYWTTIFFGTCGMCTPSQVTKYLSIFSFLTELSGHHMDSHYFFNIDLFWLPTSFSPIRILTTFLLQHLIVFHTIFLDVSWFSTVVASITARNIWIFFWVSYSLISPLTLDNQSWSLLCEIFLLHQLVVSKHLSRRLQTLIYSYHTWW